MDRRACLRYPCVYACANLHGMYVCVRLLCGVCIRVSCACSACIHEDVFISSLTSPFFLQVTQIIAKNIPCFLVSPTPRLPDRIAARVT